MNKIFCKIDNKGAISGYATIFSTFSLVYGIKWHILGVQQWFFCKNWFFTFIYPIHFGQYKGKTKILRKMFCGKKWVFLSNVKLYLPTNGRGTSKNANIFRFLGDPIFTPYKDWFKIVFTFLPLKKLKSPTYSPHVFKILIYKCILKNNWYASDAVTWCIP